MNKDKLDIPLFYIDTSFDYSDSPYGSGTYYLQEAQGFEITLDKNDVPILSEIKGYGYFNDIDKCKSYPMLYEYLSNLIKDIKTGVYKKAWNPYKNIEDWIPILEELKDSSFEMMKPAQKVV